MFRGPEALEWYYCGSPSRSRCGILLWMLVETTGGERIGLFRVETFDEVVNHYLPETLEE
jgi:hypothetical protein